MNQRDYDIDTSAEITKIWKLLEEVYDPEVPVLSVLDLGIVRNVTFHHADESVTVTITPTYSGCPAMDMISMNIRMMLLSHGYKNVNVVQTLSPAWTTDWMTEKGKEKLKEYGIAPPNIKQQVCSQELFVQDEAVQCPHCHSYHTQRISEFGSTACKSLYQCKDCKEPFDYFKCH
jgi:ring-1,2-phenylacetyl-CoA epoxidase subunit PaaD